ncbi:hypothetical protein HK103_003895 [Boothiomyces macroporosus]|uniref:Uncharacterized protein n=1 Tax=Boothiomyces macroporosus TaxID=261099 RepID=A0AAD5UM96_9FUNG|nr:hypothetical protein HK103_003895 [Boothiomyces macroporosus]
MEQNKEFKDNEKDTVSLNESFKSCENESLVSINDESSGVEIGKSNSIMVPKPQEYRADTLQRKPTLHKSAPDLTDRSSIDTVAISNEPADEQIEIISLSPVLLVSDDYHSISGNVAKQKNRIRWYHNTLLVSAVVVGCLIVLGIVLYFLLPQLPKLDVSDLFYTLNLPNYPPDIIPAFVNISVYSPAYINYRFTSLNVTVQLASGYLPSSIIENIDTQPRHTTVIMVPFNITKQDLNGQFNVTVLGQFSPLSWMGVNPTLKTGGKIKPAVL